VNIRDELILREFNLYPLWVRRDSPVPLLRETQESSVARSALTKISVDPSLIELKTVPLKDIEKQEVEPVPPRNNSAGADWPALKQQVLDCNACKLRAGCTQTVFGAGDEKAEWLFVGEGPGADEDEQGKLLDNMLAAIKLKRGQNVFIANIVKCLPPNNRTPEAGEIAQCLPYLQRQVALIKPKLIVALGKTAATALLGRDAPLGSLRGTLHEYQGIPLIITYHPAYLLRSPAEKAKAWQDLCFAVATYSA
jgi:DNA polymerase